MVVMADNYIVINQVMYDTPLNEMTNISPSSNGEFIELYNAGSNPVSLQGWKLTGDGTSENFVFIDDIIIEGLDIDEQQKLVSLTDKHNKGIDLEIEKPIYTKINDINNDINVYSIFKRTKLKTDKGFARDGNPFIYALKNINGRQFPLHCTVWLL